MNELLGLTSVERTTNDATNRFTNAGTRRQFQTSTPSVNLSGNDPNINSDATIKNRVSANSMVHRTRPEGRQKEQPGAGADRKWRPQLSQVKERAVLAAND